MSRFKKLMLRICGLHTEPHVEAPVGTPKKAGVLFGLNPPEGHHFNVRFSTSSSIGAWHVHIVDKEDRYIVSDCELLYDYNSRGNKVRISDEEAIKRAALSCLSKYKHQQNKLHFVGDYPPKNTGDMN